MPCIVECRNYSTIKTIASLRTPFLKIRANYYKIPILVVCRKFGLYKNISSAPVDQRVGIKINSAPVVSHSITLKLNFSTASSKINPLCLFWKKMGDTSSQHIEGLKDTTGINRPGKIKLTDEEWKKKLTPEQYQVTRKHGTERAFTGALLDNKKKGVYRCVGCGTELFDSNTKFDSGSGWPSFNDVLKDKDMPSLPAVDVRVDSSFGMTRTEVLCGKCDAHLGHVFNDGPRPTGQRYCINSVCLKFKPEEKGGAGPSDSRE